MKDEKESGAPRELVDLRIRTRNFAKRVVKLFVALPKTDEARVLGRQLLRSGTSVGAHYREACRARSDAEFISKMEVGLQELDESAYWMELLIDCHLVPEAKLQPLRQEADELIAILASIVKTKKAKR